MFAGQPSPAQWQHAARCGDRLEGIKEEVLGRCGVTSKTYNEYAIPQVASTDRIRAELRCSGYVGKPNEAVEYLQGISGEYLHPEMVNFDVAAKDNYAAFKEQLCGRTSERMTRVCILPDDDSVQRLTKAELVQRLESAITSSYSGNERDMRMKIVTRTKTKAGLIALMQEAVGVED